MCAVVSADFLSTSPIIHTHTLKPTHTHTLRHMYSTNTEPHAFPSTCCSPHSDVEPSLSLLASSCWVWGDRHTYVHPQPPTPHACCKPGWVVFLACSKQRARLSTNTTPCPSLFLSGFPASPSRTISFCHCLSPSKEASQSRSQSSVR